MSASANFAELRDAAFQAPFHDSRFGRSLLFRRMHLPRKCCPGKLLLPAVFQQTNLFLLGAIPKFPNHFVDKDPLGL